MPLYPNQVLQNGRYRVLRLLGQGGMGAVFQAWDNNLNIPVAIKENQDYTAEAQQLFIQEAQMLSRLTHPNLPRVSDYFIIPNQGEYLVMDFVEGQDLLEMLLQAGQPLPESHILPWIGQVCDAVAHLHALNPPIIHRDIKPDNIKIRPDGRAVLVDFGIAKFYDPARATLLAHGRGTPGYCPPEQYGRGRTDARTDVYALGATLYALLTGVEPPESVDLVAGNAHLRSPRQANPQISPRTESIIIKCMGLDSRARFQSMAELQDALSGRAPLPAAPQAAQAMAAPLQPAPVSPSAATPVGLSSLPTVVTSAARPSRLRACLGTLVLLLIAVFCLLLLTISSSDGRPVLVIPSALATFFPDPNNLPVFGPFVRVNTPEGIQPSLTVPPLPAEPTRARPPIGAPTDTPRGELIVIHLINRNTQAARGVLYQVIAGQDYTLTGFDVPRAAQRTIRGYYGPGLFKIRVNCGEKTDSIKFYFQPTLTLTIDSKCQLVR